MQDSYPLKDDLAFKIIIEFEREEYWILIQ
jgi:hypothetical protein